jgi:hypothetical protein
MRLQTLYVALLAYGASCDGGSPPIGLKPGDAVSAFGTKAVTGPQKGQALCYI